MMTVGWRRHKLKKVDFSDYLTTCILMSTTFTFDFQYKRLLFSVCSIKMDSIVEQVSNQTFLISETFGVGYVTPQVLEKYLLSGGVENQKRDC